LFAAAALFLFARVALADAALRSMVVLVAAEPADPNLDGAYLRMRGELSAVGFAALPIASAQNVDPASALSLAAEGLSPAAVIGIFENPSGALEFWILDVRSGKTAVKRMARGGDAGRASEILAISAVELLLASLSELDIKPESAPAAPAPKPLEPAKLARVPPREAAGGSTARPPRFGLELGLGAAVATGGVGVAWLPAVRVQWSPVRALRVRLSGLGFGTRPTVSKPEGSARTSQDIALAEAVFRPWDFTRVYPQFSLGAGAYYFEVAGQSLPGSVGATASQWSAAFDLGAELAWRQQSHLELLVGAHALFAQPYPAVRFFGVEQANAGRPTIVLSATVAGWL
jgi:hypothetical protein